MLVPFAASSRFPEIQMRTIRTLGVLVITLGCGSAAPHEGTVKTYASSDRNCPTMTFGNNDPGPTSNSVSARPSAGADDPTVTDGDKYRVVLENERVRVLRYQDKPGDKTHPHHHVEFVLYALSPFRRRLIFADGSVRERDFSPGDAIWMPDQIHTGENIGTTDTDVIIVENKLAAGAAARSNQSTK
jgi:beta-alanine degradation protein BauB